LIKEIEIKYTPDLFDDDNSIIIGFDDQDQCFTRTFIDDNNEKVTMPISIDEILKFFKLELEHRLDPYGIKASMNKKRRCAINGCKNPSYILDQNRFPDGTEGNTTLCKEHWERSKLEQN